MVEIMFLDNVLVTSYIQLVNIYGLYKVFHCDLNKPDRTRRQIII